MRKVATCISLLGLALLAISSIASAAPTVTIKAKAVPIKGYPGTGNIYGAGAAVEAQYNITGTEYGGSPPPIIGVNFYLPKGTVLHPSGFPTCTKVTLEQFGPSKCPKGSAAGPIGVVHGYVTLGGNEWKRKPNCPPFYVPGGGFEFFTDGHSPVSLEILSGGHYINLGGGGGFGPKLITQVPLWRASRELRTHRSSRSPSRSARRSRSKASPSTTDACRT